jgi:dihydroneopterin aldolase
MTMLPLLRHHRRLFVRGLCLPVHIGIHDFEQNAPQRIIFDIELYVPLHNTTPTQDHIHEVVDYDFVRQVVHARVAQGHINLQETLGDDILTALLAHPGVAAASVSTRKPDVYPDCEAVGVQTFRAKPGVEGG